MAYKGFCLSITGFPYTLGTESIDTLPTSTSPLWFGGETVLAQGFLVNRNLRWGEKARPIDGELEVDAVTFTLLDGKISTGLASGNNLFTYLSTFSSYNQISTPLVATLEKTTLTFTVGSGALLAGASFVWINREAMPVTSIVGNLVTVTSRGKLGTSNQRHIVNDDLNPEVFRLPPWVQRRKVVLWGVDQNNVATALWMGFSVRAPRLTETGTDFEFPCDPYLQVIQESYMGDPTPVAQSVGYNNIAAPIITAAIWQTRTSGGATIYEGNAVSEIGQSFRTWDQYSNRITELVRAISVARSQGISITIGLNGDSDGIFSADSPLAFYAACVIGNGGVSRLDEVRQESIARTIDPVTLTTQNGVTINFGRVFPTMAAIPILAQEGITIGTASVCLSSISNIPAYSLTSPDDFVDVTTPLVASFGEDYILSISSYTTSNTSTLGPNMSGNVSAFSRTRNRREPVVISNSSLLFKSGFRVAARHWFPGLRYGVIPSLQDAQAEVDFDWSNTNSVLAVTSTGLSNRVFTLDGTKTFGSLMTELTRFYGLTPGIDKGRITFIPWQWPDERDTAFQITNTDVIGNPIWGTWNESFANRLEINSEKGKIIVLDNGSIARYGEGRKITIDVGDRTVQSQSFLNDPVLASRQALGRLSLWTNPLPSVKFKSSLRYYEQNTLKLGDTIQYTDWLSPDGMGNRAISGQKGKLTSRYIDLDEGTVEYEAIFFGREARGYAPCIRVLSVVSSDTIDVAKDYVQLVYPSGTQQFDYGGGKDGFGNDTLAGTNSIFTAGEQVQLITRNSTSQTTEDLKIHDVTWTGTEWRIQFATNISAPMQALIGSTIVDMRYANFAIATDSQKTWMFIGNETTGLIDGTAVRARPIAP